MAQSIRNIIAEINKNLAGVFPGGIVYGVAESVTREGKTQPVSNERAVGFDDDYSVQIYHKLGEIGVSYKAGFGEYTNTINTFSVSMIVFNNERKSKLKADEIAMIIQSQLAKNITSTRILPQRIILNSAAIFSTEYKGFQYPLDEYLSLMQFNYLVEITFKSGCFDLCPEDFKQCKTL